jgi:hypothetical protein
MQLTVASSREDVLLGAAIIMWEDFRYRWNHERDVVPQHVLDFVDNIVREVDEFGYAVWQEHRYTPPDFIIGHEAREKDHSACMYQQYVAGLGICWLDKIKSKVRDLHKHYRYNKNVFYKSPHAEESLRMIQAESHKH